MPSSSGWRTVRSASSATPFASRVLEMNPAKFVQAGMGLGRDHPGFSLSRQRGKELDQSHVQIESKFVTAHLTDQRDLGRLRQPMKAAGDLLPAQQHLLKSTLGRHVSVRSRLLQAVQGSQSIHNLLAGVRRVPGGSRGGKTFFFLSIPGQLEQKKHCHVSPQDELKTKKLTIFRLASTIALTSCLASAVCCS
jgi:hypothetical protein